MVTQTELRKLAALQARADRLREKEVAVRAGAKVELGPLQLD